MPRLRGCSNRCDRVDLNALAHAVAFCVQNTAIQALNRKERMLPLSPASTKSQGFEHKPHGTLGLVAAFNTTTGEVLGETAASRTSEQLVAFRTDVAARQSKRRDFIPSATTSAAVVSISRWRRSQCASQRTYALHADLLVVANPNRKLVLAHQRNVTARGIFTSMKDVGHTLTHYIRAQQKVGSRLNGSMTALCAGQCDAESLTQSASRTAAAMLCKTLTNRTASSSNSSVYRARIALLIIVLSLLA